MLRSELLEREAEARRIELAETFDELRARATPGHVLDHLVDYASASGGVDFFRNLRDQTVANPLALGLVGAGLAWLMMSNARDRRVYSPYDVYEAYDEMRPPGGRTRGYFAGARERAGDALSGARHFMSGATHGIRDRVTEATHMASEAAGSIASTARSARDAAFGTASSLGEAASSLGGQARERAGDTTASLGSAASALYGGVSTTAGRTASGVRALASGTAATSRDMFDVARDQPLILAGLGLAFGAAMGAAFRSTETERQLMGEASDELKERTQALAAQNYERSRSMAEAIYDELQNRGMEGSSQSAGSPPKSGQSMANQTGSVPIEEEITEIQEKLHETTRPERIGLRDDRS